MTDDPTAGDPETGGSDLYARIQGLEAEVDAGLTPAQVEASVRSAVGDLLPGLVADAVGAAIAAALPGLVRDAVDESVVPSVAGALQDGRRGDADEQLEARLAALEDALDGVGDRIESMARDGASSTSASIEQLRMRMEAMAQEGAGSGLGDRLDDLRSRIEAIAESGDDRNGDAQRAEIDALRVDMANALDYVRESVLAQVGERFDRTQEVLQEVTAAIAELPAAGRAEAADDDRDGPDQQELLDRLDALAESRGPDVDLGPVHDKLDAIFAGLAVAGPDLSPVEDRLESLAAAVRESGGPVDLAPLHDRLDALGAASGAELDLSPVHDKLDAIFAGLAVSGPDLSPVEDRLESMAAVVRDSGGPVDLAPLHDRLDALADEIGSPGPDLAPLQARLDELALAVEVATAATGDRVAVENDRQTAALEQGLTAAVSGALAGPMSDTVASSVREAVADLVQTAHVTAARLDAVEDALARGEATHETALTALRDAVTGSGDLGRDVAERVSDDLGDVRAELSAVREQVAGLGGPTEAVGSELDALRRDLADALDSIPALVREAAADVDLRVADLVVELRTDQATAAAESLGLLTELAAREVPDLTPQLEGLADRLDARIAALADDLRGARDEQVAAVAGVGEHLTTVLDPSEALLALRDRLDDLPDAADALGRVHDQLADLVAVVGDLPDLRVRIEELADQVAPLAAAVPELAARTTAEGGEIEELARVVRALPDQLEGWRADAGDDRRRLTEALQELGDARDEVSALLVRIAAESGTATDALRDAALAALEQARAAAASAVDELRTETDDARGGLDDYARSVRAQVAEQARAGATEVMAEVRAALAAQADQAAAARVEIERVAERVQSAGRLLVAYLGERDVALEEVRDRTTVALLEDVLSGLGRKERDRATDHARGVFARRRESRQAERWRRHKGGGPEPTGLPVDDGALQALLDGEAESVGSTPPAAVASVDVPESPPVGVAPDPAADAAAAAAATGGAPSGTGAPPMSDRDEGPAAVPATDVTTPAAPRPRPVPRTPARPRTAGKSPAKTATRTPAKTATRTPAKTPTKAPTKTNTPAKTVGKTPTKTVAKVPAKATPRAAAKTPAKAPARTAAKAARTTATGAATAPPAPPRKAATRR